MRSSLFFAALLCLLLTACGDKNNAANTATTTTPTNTPPATTTTANTYPSIPLERLEYLWDNADYMDVIFYDLPISMNQNSLENIRSTLIHISDQTPQILPECKSIGRIFFQVEGKAIETAEIYFQQGCTFYLWLENDQPAFANMMTEDGISFYNNIFRQVQEQAQ